MTSYTIGPKGIVTPVDQQPSNGFDPANLLATSDGKEIIEPNVSFRRAASLDNSVTRRREGFAK